MFQHHTTGVPLYACLDVLKHIYMINVSTLNNTNGGLLIQACINTNLYHTYHNKTEVVDSATIHIVYHMTGNQIILQNSTEAYILKSVLSGVDSDIKIINAANIYITNTTCLITAYNTANIDLKDTLYHNVDVPSTVSRTSGPTNLPAVITLDNTTLTIKDCIFAKILFPLSEQSVPK